MQKKFVFIPLIALLVIVPSAIMVTGSSPRPVYNYNITPSSQSFNKWEFVSSICTDNHNIDLVKVTLTEPNGSSLTATFNKPYSTPKAHCIDYQGAVPHIPGQWKISAVYLSYGVIKGRAFAVINGAS